jgi:hypothetical protein
MTCQECELALASEPEMDASEHLAACSACREFAVELRANSEAMLALAAEPMPPARRVRPARWPWVTAAAIAAMIVLMLAIFNKSAERAPLRARLTDAPNPIASAPEIQMQVSPVRAHIPRRAPKKHVQPQLLQVKMLTADPDVVIYWQVEY